MTAIAGYWAVGGGEDPLAACAAMLDAQHLYGPAHRALRSEGAVALGKRLFPTLPEDRFDTGPVAGGGGRWLLTADVRLDNRDELEESLGVAASEAACMSDTHVVMRAIERWEEEAVARLVGDFALALFDRERGRLLLARDFAGQRPLHFHRGAGFFAFASMPKGLHALPDVPDGVDPDALGEFLALTPHAGRRTFHRGICRLLPGELCVAGEAGESFRRYWTCAAAPLLLKRSEDYAEAVREALDRAVAARLRGAAGSVAAHLSGGLDSGAVAATAARLLAPNGRVVAFTAVPREGYDPGAVSGRLVDEGAHAAAVAALHPNMDHVFVRTAGRSLVADLDRNVYLYDRPVVNLCNDVWAKAIAEQAQQRGLKVLLIGQMGNFSFSHAGLERLAELFAEGRLLRLLSESGLLRRRGLGVQAILASAIGPFVPAPLWRALRKWSGRAAGTFSLTRPSAATGFARRAVESGRSGQPVRNAKAFRIEAISGVEPGDFYKGALGGWSLDVRDPTADRRLVELCLSIPAAEYLSGGYPRALARRAFADRLPEIVTQEIRKGYQAADWHEGLVADIEAIRAEAMRISTVPEVAEVLDTGRMAAMLECLPEDGWSSGPVVAMYRFALLRGLSAGHFVRTASEPDRRIEGSRHDEIALPAGTR